jgi:hypothetical protein
MYNQNPSTSWASFSTFLDQINQNPNGQAPAQPGAMPTWEEQYQLGDTRMLSQPQDAQTPAAGNPMDGFPQSGPQQNNPLQQQVLDKFQNPAQQIFNEIGQGGRYSQRRQQQQGRGINKFNEYGSRRHLR